MATARQDKAGKASTRNRPWDTAGLGGGCGNRNRRHQDSEAEQKSIPEVNAIEFNDLGPPVRVMVFLGKGQLEQWRIILAIATACTRRCTVTAGLPSSNGS